MDTFIDEILADIDWRVSELAIIKSLPIRYRFSPDHKELQIKYSVPAIYSIWEGYVKSTFSIYSDHLNSLSITRNQIAYNLLTHHLDSECSFNNARISFETKRKMVENIDNILTDTIMFKPCVPTESNVNLKVLNRIHERFCVDLVDDKYNNSLNKLLLFRNKISHGENAITVSMSNISEFIKLVEDLMLDIIINLEKSEKAKTYLRH